MAEDTPLREATMEDVFEEMRRRHAIVLLAVAAYEPAADVERVKFMHAGGLVPAIGMAHFVRAELTRGLVDSDAEEWEHEP